MPETLAHEPLDAIACHRVMHGLARQGHTQAGMALLIARCQQRHPAITQPVACLFEYPLVCARVSEPYPSRETRRAGAQGYKSHGQAVAALGATCIDYATAIFGTHAGAKTVSPLALQIAGLIGSFHGTLRF